jgi:hypothetical protein
LSGCHGRQADDGIIADGRDGFLRHVTRTLDRPFVVLFEQDGADETPDGASGTRPKPVGSVNTILLSSRPLLRQSRSCCREAGMQTAHRIYRGWTVKLRIKRIAASLLIFLMGIFSTVQ